MNYNRYQHLHFGLSQLGVALSLEQYERFEAFEKLLSEWNTAVNLTRIGSGDTQDLHFVDSATVVKVVDLRSAERLVDVGSGGGFPGLPLAILFPQLEVTAVESNKKKYAFLQAVKGSLGLTNVLIVNERVEDFAHQAAHREQFDVAVARAVASLGVLAEWLLPLVRLNGHMVAYKGDPGAAEQEMMQSHIAELGGIVETPTSFRLPGREEVRTLVSIRKGSTSPAYAPRPPNQLNRVQKRQREKSRRQDSE